MKTKSQKMSLNKSKTNRKKMKRMTEMQMKQIPEKKKYLRWKNAGVD